MSTFPMSYAGSGDPQTLEHDTLIAGEFPVITRKVTVTGGSRKRGDVLGKVTADGKYKLSEAAADDGSEEPVAILMEDVDASGSDKEAFVYETGLFNQNALTFGDGHDVDSTRTDLRRLGIHLKASKPA